MNNLIENTYKIFKDIKYIDENGNEYWCARELMIIVNVNMKSHKYFNIKMSRIN